MLLCTRAWGVRLLGHLLLDMLVDDACGQQARDDVLPSSSCRQPSPGEPGMRRVLTLPDSGGGSVVGGGVLKHRVSLWCGLVVC